MSEAEMSAEEQADLAEFMRLKGKALPPAPVVKEKKTRKPRESKVAVVSIPVFDMGATVKIRRPATEQVGIRTIRISVGTKGKVVKVHTDYNPPRWYTVEFPLPSATEPTRLNLIVNDLELVIGA